jgi:hypothetical protein
MRLHIIRPTWAAKIRRAPLASAICPRYAAARLMSPRPARCPEGRSATSFARIPDSGGMRKLPCRLASRRCRHEIVNEAGGVLEQKEQRGQGAGDLRRAEGCASANGQRIGGPAQAGAAAACRRAKGAAGHSTGAFHQEGSADRNQRQSRQDAQNCRSRVRQAKKARCDGGHAGAGDGRSRDARRGRGGTPCGHGRRAGGDHGGGRADGRRGGTRQRSARQCRDGGGGGGVRDHGGDDDRRRLRRRAGRASGETSSRSGRFAAAFNVGPVDRRSTLNAV